MKTPEEFMEERGFYTHSEAMTEVSLVSALMLEYAEYYHSFFEYQKGCTQRPAK